MKIETTGVVFHATCDVQASRCVAKEPAPVKAVWELPGREQINVCRACLDEKVGSGERQLEGARASGHAGGR